MIFAKFEGLNSTAPSTSGLYYKTITFIKFGGSNPATTGTIWKNGKYIHLTSGGCATDSWTQVQRFEYKPPLASREDVCKKFGNGHVFISSQ
jgi:hypothetical protein